jgi:hypothetical protein
MRLKSDKKVKTKSSYRVYWLYVFFLCTGIFIGWKDIPGFLKSNILLLQKLDIAEVFFAKNSLNSLNLNIKFENIEKLRIKREEALNKGLLIRSDNDFVNSKISYNSEPPQACKIRLKGDLAQHWNGDKWSLRINTKNGNSIEGMTTFSIQDPITRNYTYEWLFLQNLKYEDVLAPNYFFLNVNINGEEKGIYALEEHFSKEMIEKKNRREGIVLSFNEHHMWNLHWNVSWPISYRTSGIEVRDLKRVNAIPQLSKQRDTAVSLLRNFQARLLDAEQVLDHEKTAKFLALSNLWGADHGLSYADINFYYNPITAKLEPIAMDAKPEFTPTPPSDYFTHGEMEETWVNYALKSEHIAKLYTQYLNEFTNDEYLQNLYERFGEEEIYYRNLLKKEILLENKHYIWRADKIILSDPWNIVKHRATAIRRGLDDPNIALFYAYLNKNEKNSNYLKIVARNTLNQPVEIRSFQLNGIEYLANDIVLNKTGDLKLPLNTTNVILAPNRWLSDIPRNDVFFKIPFPYTIDEINSSSVISNVRILGLDDFLQKSVNFDGSLLSPNYLPSLLSSSKVRDKNSFIKQNGNNYYIQPGSYLVSRDIVIPTNCSLTIEKGTTLRFTKNTVLYIEGALFVEGRKKSPVIFTAEDISWGGVLVTNAKARSKVNFLTCSNANGIGPIIQEKGIDRTGWMLTGAVTFNRSNVDIFNSSFHDIKSEDALNIVSSDFTIQGCFFSQLASDAFDGDFVNGTIQDCHFSEIYGDGVDFSGSTAEVSDSKFSNIIDKAISVGEGSHVQVSNCKIENVSFGVVSKDMSTTDVFNNTEIINANTAAIAAFQKKSSFGPASIHIRNSTISKSKKISLIQEGSSGFLNSKRIPSRPFSSSDLYKSKSE